MMMSWERSIRCSQSRTRRRHRIIQPKVRLTTHLRGSTFEALLIVGPTNDLDNEVEIACLVRQLETVVGAIGKKMFDPEPAFADTIQYRLGSGAVGDDCGGQIDH
jgi:hypothetical protein